MTPCIAASRDKCAEGREKALPHGWPVDTTPNELIHFILPFISFQPPRNMIKLFYIQRLISALICFHFVILQSISPGPKSYNEVKTHKIWLLPPVLPPVPQLQKKPFLLLLFPTICKPSKQSFACSNFLIVCYHETFLSIYYILEMTLYKTL